MIQPQMIQLRLQRSFFVTQPNRRSGIALSRIEACRSGDGCAGAEKTQSESVLDQGGRENETIKILPLHLYCAQLPSQVNGIIQTLQIFLFADMHGAKAA